MLLGLSRVKGIALVVDGLQAEHEELITGVRFETFFTPNKVSKNYASHDIGIYSFRTN